MAHFAKGMTVKLSTDGRNNVEVSDEPLYMMAIMEDGE
jgi:hypothetical protein